MRTLFAKIFWRTGVPFGLWMGLLFPGIVYGVDFLFGGGLPGWLEIVTVSVSMLLIGGIGFGLAMAIVLTALQAWRTRGLPVERRWQVTQKDSLRLGEAPDTAFARGIEGLREAFGRTPNVGPSGLAASVKTKTSWDSFGEKVTLRVEPDGRGALVHVESRPTTPGTLADYGKNWRNVRAVLDRLAPHDAPEVQAA